MPRLIVAEDMMRLVLFLECLMGASALLSS